MAAEVPVLRLKWIAIALVCLAGLPAGAETGDIKLQAHDNQPGAEPNKIQAEKPINIDSGIEILGEVLFPGKGERADWLKAGTLQDKAVQLASNGQGEEAVKKARQAISIYPYDYCFFNTLGIAYSRRNRPGDLKLAKDAFEHSLELRADDPMVWDNIARVYEAQGELTRAKQAWLKCLALRPTNRRILEINENIRRCDRALSMQ
jgi:tetratricopeptide (TPR) repeat protein